MSDFLLSKGLEEEDHNDTESSQSCDCDEEQNIEWEEILFFDSNPERTTQDDRIDYNEEELTPTNCDEEGLRGGRCSKLRPEEEWVANETDMGKSPNGFLRQTRRPYRYCKREKNRSGVSKRRSS